MRILYHHRTLADGAEGIHIREMVQAFRGIGHEVRVVSLLDDGDSSNDTSGAKSSKPRFQWAKRWLPKVTYELAELGYNQVGKRRILKAIKAFQPDLIYDRYNTFCTAAVEAGRAARVPVFLEVNAPLAYERVAHDRGLRFTALAERYESRICNAADHVIVVSTPLKEFLADQRAVPESKISVLPNGVDPEGFVPVTSDQRENTRASLGIPADATVIGFTGILRPWHGVEMLCEAFAGLRSEHPSAYLLIVGDGPSEQSIRSKLRELGVTNRATLTGRVSHDQIPKMIGAMDIAVSPRATFYASPMKIVEYMAMGVPVVAPNTPNIRDLVQDEREALLFQADDSASLTAALSRLVADEELRKRLGEAGVQRVQSELNWTKIAQRVVDKAQDVIDQHRSQCASNDGD